MVNLYQGFALAIVVLMVASMVGYSFLTAPDTTPTEDTPEVAPEGPPVAQNIRGFYAEGVEAEVVQLFPVLMVTAGTDETEINRIDQAVYGIAGVSQVQSQYKSDIQGLVGSNLVYVGTVFYDPEQSKEEILASIEAIPLLDVVDTVQTGLIKVPLEARLTAEDDANTFKEHRFEEPFMEAILAFDTLKDDEVEVMQRLVFNGEQVLQAMAFEMKNLTGQEISFGAKLTDIELQELKPEFTFGGQRAYDGSLDFTGLEEEIEALPEVESVSLDVQPVQYRLSLSIDQNLETEILGDLNNGLHALPGVKEARFWHREGFDEVTVDFKADADYLSLTSEIEQAFDQAGAEFQEMKAPQVSLFGELETKVTQSQDFNQSFHRLLAENGFKGIELFQLASVDVDTVEFIGPDVILYLDENQTVREAYVFPGHQEKDRLSLDVTVYGAREKVTRLNAFESRPA